ncbi:MAG: hypothetical protein ACTSX3_04965 [Candidatus Thorarchaeota archaeon]
MTVRDGGDDISELVEEVCMMIEDWRTLVMSCSWGVLVVGVQDCPDHPALLVTQDLLDGIRNLGLVRYEHFDSLGHWHHSRK